MTGTRTVRHGIEFVYQIPYNLAHIYRDRRDIDNFLRYLVVASKIKGVHGIVFREIGEIYTVRGNLSKARRAFDIALKLGMDSTFVIELDKKFPGLIQPPKISPVSN